MKVNRIPAEEIARIDKFDAKVGIYPGAKTMARWTTKYRHDGVECSSKTFQEMFGFRQ